MFMHYKQTLKLPMVQTACTVSCELSTFHYKNSTSKLTSFLFIRLNSAKQNAEQYEWIKSEKGVNEEAANAYRVITAMTGIVASFAKTG